MAMGKDLPQSFGQALKIARRILSSNIELVRKNLVDPEAEQIVLGAYRACSGKYLNRMEFFSRQDDAFPPAAGRKVLEWATQRSEGKLLQHLLGFQFFLENEYEVSPAVLVPRPETELLVRQAIEELSSQSPVLGMEVGVGSGAIAIELLCAFPQLRMLVSEIEVVASEMALRNGDRILGAEERKARLEIVMAKEGSEVLEPFHQPLAGKRADFLISNPPYLSGEDEVDVEVRLNEPPSALFAPKEDALFFYRRIATEASALLNQGAPVLVEIPHERARQIQDLFDQAGWKTRMVRDLNDRNRVMVAYFRRKGEGNG